MIGLDLTYLKNIARMALEEDLGNGDITSFLTIPETAVSEAIIYTKSIGIVAGLELTRIVFQEVDSKLVFLKKTTDGKRLLTGTTVALIKGNTRSILAAERVALNFLQRMSGVATMANYYCDLVAESKARIVDTRKTTPGLRRLEKYAVCVGGGYNHRFGLSDGILIKDNHIAASSGITEAVEKAKRGAPHTMKIEVEVTSLNQLMEAIAAGADAVLLDNMDLETMRRAVKVAQGKVLLEASGGVDETSVADIAATGVDIISSGALTHSVTAMDMSLKIIG